jgi:hypothetical protein
MSHVKERVADGRWARSWVGLGSLVLALILALMLVALTGCASDGGSADRGAGQPVAAATTADESREAAATAGVRDTAATASEAPTQQDPAGDAAAVDEPAQPVSVWPGIMIDAERRHIDLIGTVVNREADWMELLVCSPGTLEYEAILTVDARPSHIHLALLTIGLEPGNALSYRLTEEGTYEIIPPAGPKVAVYIVKPAGADNAAEEEVPANLWVRNQQTGETLPSNIWLFTGSSFVEHEGQRIYMADLNGTILTLVNFGDDLLARATELTNQTDGGEYNANVELVPEKGTRVTVRLRPVSPNDKVVGPTPAKDAEP